MGDIVEATIAFVCIPLKDECFMMTHQLHALTLLDDNIRKVSSDTYTTFSNTNDINLQKILYKRQEVGPSIRKASSSVKRKPLYEDDVDFELEIVTSKMRMD